ncbi:hypothetical protein ACTP13_24105 [Paenibacillus peoriae]|uniref:hypothetical protein n=1 Tax=Paenibacillus peoriae TaxID=59893 RepID=UPI003F9ACDA7
MSTDIYVNTVLALWDGEHQEKDLVEPILYRVLWVQQIEDIVVMIDTKQEEKGHAPLPEFFHIQHYKRI